MCVLQHPFAQSAIALIATRLNDGLCQTIEESDVALALRAGTLEVLDSELAKELLPTMFRECEASLVISAAIESGGSVASASQLYWAAVAAGCAPQGQWSKVSTWVPAERSSHVC